MKAITVPEQAFNALRDAYGVDHAIMRNVVKGKFMRTEVFVEIYPFEIKVF